MAKTLNGFLVYGQPGCEWCERAVTLLERFGHPFVYFDVKEEPHHMIRLRALNLPKLTVPQVWIGDKHIGGHDDLKRYLREFDEA
jgi:glutaredoxin